MLQKLEKLRESLNIPNSYADHTKTVDVASSSAKVGRLTDDLEEVQVTTRNNITILHQLIFSMEERLNKRIDDVREEMVQMIEGKSTKIQKQLIDKSKNVAPPNISKGPNKGLCPQDPTISKGSNKILCPQDITKTVPRIQNLESFYDMVSIEPTPGFVIKTRKLLGEKSKVFINVFHHQLIEVEPSGMPKDKATNKPYMMMEAPTTTIDKEGQRCMTFNVGISSEYFIQPNPALDISITAPSSIYKVMLFIYSSCSLIYKLSLHSLLDNSQSQSKV